MMSDTTLQNSTDKLKVVIATTAEQKKLGEQIRQQVFVCEQGVPLELEKDGKDGISEQYLAILRNAAIGTARSRRIGQNEEKIERVAIVYEYRGLSHGFRFMQQIMNLISMRGIEKVTIFAQIDVVPFYRRLNFKPVGPRFIEAGIVHQEMTIQHLQLGATPVQD